MKFSFLYTIQSSKLMTGNGAIGVIEPLDRPIAAGLVFAASLFDFTPNNTIAMPDKSAGLNYKVPPSLAAFVNAFLRTR
ncbi:hypothetical protein ACQE3E_13545 [Methylomonas sp. MED-D]|uniref:hypothetical protein n=1 Tax=unclassified Methylomonas TaxID=2608980 RepID=UPI0028A3C8AB|nr:hypothetical protein [Methylomonas sp. MV1]MDT4331556.1 hypothetical protein [Methylomonas sp. MV1]